MILIDGVFHDGMVAPFNYADRGFTLGDGLFETMLSLGGVVHRCAEHLDRMQAGLDVLDLRIPRDRLEADVASMVSRLEGAPGVVRLTVTRGAGARGLAPPRDSKPTTVVTLAPFDPGPMMRPTTLSTATARRNDRSPLSRLKALGYLDAVLAVKEALARGAGDALFLDTADRVACTSVANVFRVADGRLETPPADDGVLAGIVRARLLALAPSVGLVPVERSLAREDLFAADGVFLTNSLRLVQPVTVLDGQALSLRAAAAVGDLFARLCDDVGGETGIDPRSLA